jgi:hypothetical protein
MADAVENMGFLNGGKKTGLKLSTEASGEPPVYISKTGQAKYGNV